MDKIEQLNRIERFIKGKSKETLIEKHKELKLLLDNYFDNHTKIDEMIDFSMNVELYVRKAAYPELNTIELTYLELRELNSKDNLDF